MTALRQPDVSRFHRRHFRGVVNEQLFALLIADPEFRFIGRESGSVRTVRNLFFSRKNAMQSLAFFKVDHIKADMIAEAHIGDAVGAIHGVGEDSSFAHVLDLPDQAVVGRIKNR